MGFLIGFLMFLQLFAALLLVGIILIQQSKAGGGLGAMGGGTTETVFGATAGNVLTKGTVILASIFLGSALLVQVLNAHNGSNKSQTETIASDVVPAAVAVESNSVDGVAVPAEGTEATQPAAEAAPAATTEEAKPAAETAPAAEAKPAEAPKAAEAPAAE